MRYYVSWKTTGYFRSQPEIGGALSCQRMLAFLLYLDRTHCDKRLLNCRCSNLICLYVVPTRWLYCVECPQYSSRRRSASNIHRSGRLCYVKTGLWLSVYTGKFFSIITNIPLII